MSFLDKLSGGTTSKTYLHKGQEQQLNNLWSEAQNLYSSGQSPVAAQTPQFGYYQQLANQFAGQAGDLSQLGLQHSGDSFALGNAGRGYMMNVLAGGGFAAPYQTGVNMDTVNGLINNDLLNSQIDASTRDIYRNLNENTMTGIASGAQASGNAGSSRRGVAEAIAARGAKDRASDVEAGIRSNAYNQAVGVAANQAAANQNAQMGTNSLNANFGQNAFSSGFGMGYNGLNSGYNFGAGGVGIMGGAANMAQNYAQQVAMAPWQALQLYQGAVGAPITLQEQTTSGDMLGAVGGLFSGLGGAMSAWKE